MIVLPVVSILAEALIRQRTFNFWSSVGEWFLFWAVGLRLLTAGLFQVIKPTFTSQSIFQTDNAQVYAVIRELGFANICTGLAGIISLFLAAWRIPVAFVGGLFLGIAGAQHAVKRQVTINEKIAMITDILVFLVLVSYILGS
jgi:hypothetical protein